MLKRFAGVLAVGVCTAGFVMTAAPGAAYAQGATYSVPAGNLRQALDAFARQSGRQVIYRSDEIRGARSRGAHGALSPDAALQAILAGTGFGARVDASGAIAIVRLSEAGAGGAAAEGEGAEIVVTGTNIRGVVPDSSPLTVVSRAEMDARGATTAEQVVNTFTQNFNSVNAGGLSATRSGYFNADDLNGVDLRGLGPGTTLVLLNGRRISGSSSGQVVDLSLIPLAAVERVEMLTDSASSVYGSDAVGGVVNFILRDRFRGVEATAGYGTTDDGAMDEFRASLTGGLNWSTGNLVASASYLTRSALTTDERDFSSDVGGRYSLSPPEERYNLFLNGRQAIGDRLTLNADGLYSRRTSHFELFRDLGVLAGRGAYQPQDDYVLAADSWFGSIGATYEASAALTLDLAGSYSRSANASDVAETSAILAPRFSTQHSNTRTWDLTGKASGRLLPLPGGDLSYSLGIGTTREALWRNSNGSLLDLHRSTYYAFGELNLPLIGGASAIPGIYRFEINASARYSHYSDFGGNVSPKVGALWAVTNGFNLRASYGRTFRAPYLSDLGQGSIYQILNPSAAGFPIPTGANGRRIGLYLDSGVVSDLGPETSNLLAVGLDLRPPSVPRLAMSLTYVSIDYRNRIARGDPSRGSGYFLRPDLYPELYNFAPTRDDFAQILSNATLGLGNNVTGFDFTNPDALAANVGYILDNRLRNIAQSQQKAVDITASYAFTRNAITYSLGANATYILQADARTTPSSVVLPQINILARPVDFRANAYVGLATGGFSARLTGNYVGSYANPYTPLYPRIGDWLTFDFNASYNFGASRGLFSGASVLLSVRNLLDADPPFVADLGSGVTDGLSEPIGFDPTNANPLGRYIGLELRKRF